MVKRYKHSYLYWFFSGFWFLLSLYKIYIIYCGSEFFILDCILFIGYLLLSIYEIYRFFKDRKGMR